jgi:hypothetical protein
VCQKGNAVRRGVDILKTKSCIAEATADSSPVFSRIPNDKAFLADCRIRLWNIVKYGSRKWRVGSEKQR